MTIDGIFGILGIIAMLLATGTLLGLLDSRNFAPRWLLAAGALLLVNDAMLTRFYGVAPDLAASSDWNWMGKVAALAVTLAIAAHPAIGWRRCGITLAQSPEGRPLTYGVAALVVAAFVALALSLPNESPDGDSLAFQLTMPGLEEEAFYRGLLLLMLNEALRGRARMLGITVGWGALLSTILFGLAHAFSYGDGAFSFDAMTMAMTAGPAFILLWFRERTGSIVLPVLLHNFANFAPMIL